MWYQEPLFLVCVLLGMLICCSIGFQQGRKQAFIGFLASGLPQRCPMRVEAVYDNGGKALLREVVSGKHWIAYGDFVKNSHVVSIGNVVEVYQTAVNHEFFLVDPKVVKRLQSLPI
ncbi:MAG TPA: hypothetical protein VLG69_00600 [Candidatus Andersenbacteria bacterium]|nr:hypothetical protein [Candidatus Andersenbacteria bacterium]